MRKIKKLFGFILVSFFAFTVFANVAVADDPPVSCSSAGLDTIKQTYISCVDKTCAERAVTELKTLQTAQIEISMDLNNQLAAAKSAFLVDGVKVEDLTLKAAACAPVLTAINSSITTYNAIVAAPAPAPKAGSAGDAASASKECTITKKEVDALSAKIDACKKNSDAAQVKDCLFELKRTEFYIVTEYQENYNAWKAKYEEARARPGDKTADDYQKKMETCQEKLDLLQPVLANLNGALTALNTVSIRNELLISGQSYFKDAATLLGKIIDLLIKFVGTVAFIFLVIGGFRFVMAHGNENEFQQAKQMVTYAIVGLLMALLAYLIILLVQTILYRGESSKTVTVNLDISPVAAVTMTPGQQADSLVAFQTKKC